MEGRNNTHVKSLGRTDENAMMTRPDSQSSTGTVVALADAPGATPGAKGADPTRRTHRSHRRHVVFAAMVLAVLIGALVPGRTFAHGTVATVPQTSCNIQWQTGKLVIQAEFPVGSASGTTWLQAGVERARWDGRQWQYYFDGFGSWFQTDSGHFSRGQFLLGSTWYRSVQQVISNPEQASHFHFVFLIQWPDGHQQYAYSAWTSWCY
jgi:hypothetical protein